MKMYARMAILLLALMVCFGCLSVAAAEGEAALIVGGSRYDTVQQAVDAAQDGDTVELLADTTENVAISGKKLVLDLQGFTLTSAGAADGTFMAVTDGAEVTVKNGVLAGAVDADGKAVQVAQAVHVADSAFTLDAVTVSGHSVAGRGGAIYAQNATLTVRNGSVLTGNAANGTAYTNTRGTIGDGGGAIYATGSVVNVSGSSITDNTAVKSGGGVFLDASTLNTSGKTVIARNTAQATNGNNGGGGIYSVNKSTINLDDTQLDYNTTPKYGPAILVLNHQTFGNAEAPLTVNNSTINGNVAAGTSSNGGIYYSTGSRSTEKIVLKNTEICANEGTMYSVFNLSGGGGAYSDNLYFTMEDCTLDANKVDSTGGGTGLYFYYCNHITIKDTVFTNNKGGQTLLNIGNCNSMLLENDTFKGNSGNIAGAAQFTTTEGAVKNCTFENNESVNTMNTRSAGAISQTNKTSITYAGCRFTGNTSAAGAGALFVGVSSNSNGYFVVADITGTVITGNTGAVTGGLIFTANTKADGSGLKFQAGSDGTGAIYGNTGYGDSEGHDLNITINASYGELSVMAASAMKDGSTVLSDHAYFSGSTVFPKETVLDRALCGANDKKGYTVQPYVDRFVAQNVSGVACAADGEKYKLLAGAVASLEAEDPTDAAHVLKLIAGEGDELGTEIKENVNVNSALEIQLNGRAVKASTGTAITVGEDGALTLSGTGTVDTYQTGGTALAVNGECTVTGAATIPAIRLGAGKSVAVTADAQISKVYLDEEVLAELNLSAADQTVILFTPHNSADLSALAQSLEVHGINALVTVGLDESGNVVAACKAAQGVFIDGVQGRDRNSGLTADAPVKTFEKAKEILEANPDFDGIYVLNTVSVNKEFEWDLGGKWLKRYPSHTGSLVSVGSAGKLTLSNIVLDGSGDQIMATGAMVAVARGGMLTISEGAVLKNNVRNDEKNDFEYGGAVLAYGNVVMTGGKVSGNTADQGAGICMDGEGSKLTLSGGVIENNAGGKVGNYGMGPSGGGVLLVYGADMDMTGGTVSGNSSRYGGGIAVGAAYDIPASVLTMTGGTVSGNFANQHGGGIFVQTNCKAYISAGSITGNTAAPGWEGHFAGGGIYVNGNYSHIDGYVQGELHLTDALIYGNTAGTDLTGAGCGGGLAGCESSFTFIYDSHGAGIYNNTGMDLALRATNGGDPMGVEPLGDIGEYMLGGGAYNWSDANGVQYPSASLDKISRYGNAKANPTAESIAAAEALGKVLITGNVTGGNGGGIGSNGTVIIGLEEDVTDIAVTKVWNEPENQEQLTEKDGMYYLYTEEGAEIVHPQAFRVWLLRNGERVSVVEFKAVSGTEDGKAYLAWPKTLTFNDLPAGEYTYAVEEEMPDGALYTGVASGSAADGFVITNYYNPTAGVTFAGTKTLTGRDWTEDDLFTFAITEDGRTVATATADSTGVIAWPEMVYGLPDVGVHTYQVTETSTGGEGITVDDTTYTVTVTVKNVGDGTLSAEASANAAALDFTNTYRAEPAEASIPVRKVLQVPEGLTPGDVAGKFTFTLEAVDGAPLPEETTCTNPADGLMTFGVIEFTAPGTYEYTVTESGEADGVTNDPTATRSVTVEVADNGKGALTATVSSTEAAPLTFTNTYGVAPTEASIPVRKVLQAAEGLTPGDVTGKFTFTLEAADGAPLPEVTACTNPADGLMTFGAIKFTAPGIYEYTVTESGKADGVTNDPTATRSVTVEVVDQGDGTLTATVSSTEAAPLTFTNTYGVKPAEASIPVQKVLQAADGLTPGDVTGKFTFTLEAAGGAPLPEVTTCTNPADGLMTFGTIEFTAPGVYEYTVTESGEADGVTNDPTATQSVTVEVADNGDGTLTATVSSTEDAPLTFTNTYGVKPTAVSIPVQKVLQAAEGLTPADVTGRFTFTLTAAEGAPLPAVTSLTNTASGVVVFGEIMFTAPGRYGYAVTETGEASGVTNDPQSDKYVFVDVVDNGDGTMTATATSTAAAPLTFTNTYGVEPAEVVLKASKTLTGRQLAEGEFSFELKKPDGEVLQRKDNAADGSVTFDRLRFTAPGEYAYIIAEAPGEAAGVTYDKGVIEVTVTVTDNGDGTLTAEAAYGDKQSFENVYRAEGQLQLTGMKRITGREFAPGDAFAFELLHNGSVLQTCAIQPTGGEEAAFSFEPITYANGQEGTYVYTVREAQGKLKGVTYDATLYTVTVTVEDDGAGSMLADAVITVDETPVESILFSNRYEATVSLALSATKTVNGNEPAADEKFTFILSDGAGVIETVQNRQGTVTFTELDYTLADVGKSFLYTVKEKQEEIPGYTLDDTVYTVAVWVTDAGDGTLKLTRAIQANGQAVTDITFANTYEAEGTLTLTASKTVNGAEPRPDQTYGFLLKGEGVELTAVNDKGHISFDTLTYDLDDAGKTYVYTVQETTGSTEFLTADSAVYTVEVSVADNGDGTLAVEPVITLDGEKAESIAFANVLNAPLTISKTVEGCDSAGTFPITVYLYDAQGAELTDAFAYTGDVQGEIRSGEAIHLGHGQSVTIGGLVPGMKYAVEETVGEAFTTTVNGAEGVKTEGILAEEANTVAFVNTLRTTMFSVKKSWQGGGGGAIELTLYANGEKLEPQPAYDRDGDVYTYTGLPMYNAQNEPIVYSAKEKYVDGFTTIYSNVSPYSDETRAIYDGGMIINRVIVEPEFSVQKVWTGLGEEETAPEITLVLYCNGVATDEATPDPDGNGWYKYYDLPAYVDGVKAVYTVKEETLAGFETTYALADGSAADHADNGGVITNAKVPATGDEAPLALMLLLMLSSAAALLVMAFRKRA